MPLSVVVQTHWLNLANVQKTIFKGIFKTHQLASQLSQILRTTKSKYFYHPNQLSIRCVVQTFNSRLTVRISIDRLEALVQPIASAYI